MYNYYTMNRKKYTTHRNNNNNNNHNHRFRLHEIKINNKNKEEKMCEQVKLVVV